MACSAFGEFDIHLRMNTRRQTTSFGIILGLLLFVGGAGALISLFHAPPTTILHPPTPPWTALASEPDCQSVEPEGVRRAAFETLFDNSTSDSGNSESTFDEGDEPECGNPPSPRPEDRVDGETADEDPADEDRVNGDPDETQQRDALQTPGPVARSSERGVDDRAPDENHHPLGPDWTDADRTLSAEDEARRGRIRQVLDHYYRLPFNAAEDSPWSMMHHILAWGKDARNYVGAPGTKLVSTIGWICGNGPCEGERLIGISQGRLTPRNGPGLQGHDAQLLAMLAQTRISREQVLRVNGSDYHVADLIAAEQITCRSRTELTFKLISFANYLDPDATWEDVSGGHWDFPRLIEEEIAAPIIGAACGGTHRLMGLSCAVRACDRYGISPTGAWERARRHVQAYQTAAFHLQNADGSFSSDWFRRRANWGGVERKVKTSGHITEWLVYSLPQEQLRRREITRAIDFLCQALIENRYMDWPKGPLSHSIRAISLYAERAFGDPPGERGTQRPELNNPLPPRPNVARGGRQPLPVQPEVQTPRTSNARGRAAIPFRRGR